MVEPVLLGDIFLDFVDYLRFHIISAFPELHYIRTYIEACHITQLFVHIIIHIGDFPLDTTMHGCGLLGINSPYNILMRVGEWVFEKTGILTNILGLD